MNTENLADHPVSSSSSVQQVRRPGRTKPRWVPDENSPVCTNCGQKFTFTKRRLSAVVFVGYFIMLHLMVRHIWKEKDTCIFVNMIKFLVRANLVPIVVSGTYTTDGNYWVGREPVQFYQSSSCPCKHRVLNFLMIT